MNTHNHPQTLMHPDTENKTINVLYLHGFNSSPLSVKAELTRTYLLANFPHVGFHCPQLANSPKQVVAQIQQLLNSKPTDIWHFMGSSLGGYFSTYFAEQLNAKAVLINPAINPYLLLNDYIGEQTNPYTHEVYQVEPAHMQDLFALNKTNLLLKNYLVMVQTDDEVLNYQDAVIKHQGSEVIIQQGGDHSFVNFEQMLPKIADFLLLNNAN